MVILSRMCLHNRIIEKIQKKQFWDVQVKLLYCQLHHKYNNDEF
jgi:hypothetical protein